jgi:hypothetical protein
MVVTSYSSLPFWDGWEEVRFAASGGSLLSSNWLWRMHNEHPIVIPKLFLAADVRLFRARQAFLLASVLVIQFIHVLLLSWSMRVLGGWRGTLWRTGAGLSAFCLFCPSQYENFVWGFQVAWILAQLFATLSLIALMLYWTESHEQFEKQRPPKYLVLSILAALGAAHSLANGNLLWPILVVAAIYLRLRALAALSYSTAGVVSIALYLHHFVRPDTHANPVASLGAPLAMLRYCSTYIFGSWPHYDTTQERFALRLGLLIVLLPVLPYVRSRRPLTIQLVLTILYCVATALITAAGRLNFGLSSATHPRYQTVALLFWCSLGLLWLEGAFLARVRIRRSFLIAQFCLLAIFVVGATRAKHPILDTRGHAFALKAASAALVTGVFDPVSLGEVYPEMEVLTKTVPYMRANQLSVFSDGLASKVGKSLDLVFPLADSTGCSGAVESVTRVDSSDGAGLRVLGWARDHRHQGPPSSIVVTTNGMIVGLGATGNWGPYMRNGNRGLLSRHDGFIAYAPELPAGSTASFYAILGGFPPSACYIDRIVKE